MESNPVGGRPPVFESPDKLQEMVDQYFAKVNEDKTRPTITGLCLALGFESRQSFYDYEKREGFSYTIKRARMWIENAYEQLLTSGYATGAIFALKNFGWSDKQDITHSGGLQIDAKKEIIFRRYAGPGV